MSNGYAFRQESNHKQAAAVAVYGVVIPSGYISPWIDAEIIEIKWKAKNFNCYTPNCPINCTELYFGM